MLAMCGILLISEVERMPAAKNATDVEQTGAARPAISVVVPCYNGGRFLDNLMASLVCQTFRDFEIIIVDDGSSDKETLRKLASLEGQACIIRQKNCGLSAARNTGFRAARADLVMPLDCDDALEPPFFEEAVALMRSAPSDVAGAFSHMRLTGSASGPYERHFNRFDLLFINPMPAGMLMRKAVCEAAGGYDESMRDGYEDWEFYIRLMRMGYRAIEISKPYLLYCVSASGMLFSQSSGRHAALWRAIRRKHAAVYRPLAFFHLWRVSRDGTGTVSLAKGLAAYAMATLLPEAWFTYLVGRLRRRHLLEGHRAPYREVQAKSKRAA
jgi:glycosyltransferase involved in cell wall biosynthesis